MFEASVSGKWLGMLKEIEPQLARAGFVANPKTAPYYDFYLRGAKTVAPSLAIEPVLTPIENDAADVERAISAFAHAAPKGGLVVLGDSTNDAHRDLIISLAARHRLPAIYPFRYFAVDGGMMSYGIDTADPFRRAASYVDLILKGAKAADLPIQAPTKFELVVNLKTAKALGLTVPDKLLALADEVIE